MGKIKRISGFTTFLAENSAFVAVLIIFVFCSIFLPNFLSPVNISSILNQYSIIGLLALGQLLVVISGGVDLSQGGMVALYSIIAASLMQTMNPVLSLLIATVSIVLLGALNGVLIAKLKMPPFIVTFGVLQICRGIALQIADTKPVAIKIEAFTNLGFLEIAKIPFSTILWLITAFIVFYFLRNRKFGRYIFAVGSKEEDARLSGIKTNLIKFSVYVLAALFVSIGALVWTARVKSGQPIGASGYELETIAAVVVGGGSLAGGKGTVSGTIFGVLLFGLISSMLNLLGVPPLWQGMAKGMILLLAVSIGQIRKPSEKLKIMKGGVDNE